MKVCFIVSQIFAWGKFGGFGSAARTIAGELASRGIETSVVMPRSGKQRALEELDGLEVHGYNPALFPVERRVYRVCDADIYHSEEPSFGTYLAMKAMPGRKHVITFQDPRDGHDWSVFYRYWTRSKRPTFLLSYLYENNYLIRGSVKRADAAFCQAKFVTKKAADIYGLDYTPGFLPNPVSIPEREANKAERPTVSFIGRLDVIKRPQIFCELAKKFPDVKFILVGKGQDNKFDNFLRTEYSSVPNLEMTGFIDQFAEGDRFRDILDRSWIVVNTSVRECLPVSFLEAAAHKCAILSGTEKDPDDFAMNFGYYVEGDDYSKGLRYLLEGDRWREKGQKGFEYVKKVHAIDRVIDKHIEIYESLLK